MKEMTLILLVSFFGSLLIYLSYRLFEFDKRNKFPNFSSYSSLADASRERKYLFYLFLSRSIIYTIGFTLQAGIIAKSSIPNDSRNSTTLFTLLLTILINWLQVNGKVFLIDFRKLKFIVFHFLSLIHTILIAWLIWIASTDFNLINQITPSFEGMVDNIWSSFLTALLVIFYIRIFTQKEKPQQERELTLIENELYSINFKYADTLRMCKNMLSIEEYKTLISILIIESFNRPKSIRILENLFVKITKIPCTLGIAQVPSNKPLTDEESIIILSENIKKFSSEESWDKGEFLQTHNRSLRYKNNVLEIFKNIDNRFI